MLRVSAALEIEHGLIVNKKLVWKIMRQLGIRGLPGPKKRRVNLVNAATEEDLVQRNFVATRPNEVWLTDITEHPTREAKVYCCVVLDLFSRRAVGWAIDRRCEATFVNDALSMAADSRTPTAGTVIHSDHGSQLPASEWQTTPSMSTPRRVQAAMFNASSTRLVCMVRAAFQPTMRRLHTSMTKAT
jgi:putative transposase